MGVSHCHFDVGMTEHTLQDQNITTIHHKVAGKGVAQYMGKLSGRQLNVSALQCRTKSAIAILE